MRRTALLLFAMIAGLVFLVARGEESRNGAGPLTIEASSQTAP